MQRNQCFCFFLVFLQKNCWNYELLQEFDYLTHYYYYIVFYYYRIKFLCRVCIDQIIFCVSKVVWSLTNLKGSALFVVNTINALCVHPLSSAYLELGLWGLKTKLGLPVIPITSNGSKLLLRDFEALLGQLWYSVPLLDCGVAAQSQKGCIRDTFQSDAWTPQLAPLDVKEQQQYPRLQAKSTILRRFAFQLGSLFTTMFQHITCIKADAAPSCLFISCSVFNRMWIQGVKLLSHLRFWITSWCLGCRPSGILVPNCYRPTMFKRPLLAWFLHPYMGLQILSASSLMPYDLTHHHVMSSWLCSFLEPSIQDMWPLVWWYNSKFS